MLHYETVHTHTLGLLRKLMLLPQLKGFALAGGTSLALQIGHRVSVDLDFFGNRPFDIEELLELLREIAHVKPLKMSKNILILDMEGVKVDFVNYRYPLLKSVIVIDDLRLLSLEDIEAMKLAAIAGRGRKRDFTDLYFLLKHFTLADIISFYNQKYNDGSKMMIVRSLSYFEDADTDENLKLLKKVDWNEIKTLILRKIKTHYH